MFWFSPAKINLSLHVLGKRSDGYHELFTQMQTVSLGDFIAIDTAEYDSLLCSDPEIPTDGTNLVWRAVESFRNETGWQEPLSIQLDKNIPAQAGLGGGSSNAATTLWALNAMTGRPLEVERLIELGASIGSDVPFFFNYGGAICRGRGEIMEDVDSQRKKYTIVKPHYGLCTKEVFAKTVRYSTEIDCNNPIYFHNDLENAAFLLKPELAKLKADLLARGYDKVMMTGSGSALICEGNGDPTGIECQFFQVRGIGRFINEWYSVQEVSFHAGF
jgi:4-diphosphocytidyl-2-C-methyl-D-erythritol kinase